MKKNVSRLFLVFGISFLTCGVASFAQAQAADEESQLKDEQKATDQATKGATDQARIDSLAKEFSVPASTVQDLRSKGRGWGEITTELAMANRLATTDSKTYPTISDALTKVESMRGDGKGWGQIANELGFKLGPVVSDLHRARSEAVTTGGDKSERPIRPEHVGRPERMERPEHPVHPERPEHPQQQPGGSR